MQLYHLFVALTATILVPCVIGLLYYGRFRRLKPFVLLIFIGTLNEASMIYLAGHGRNNLFLLHLYMAAELLLLSWFYWGIMKSRLVRRGLVVVTAAVLGFGVVYAVIGQNIHGFNSMPRAAESVLMISLGIYFFYECATTGDSVDPFKNGAFIINGCILFYFSASFVIFACSKYVTGVGGEQLFIMAATHSFVNAFCNLVFAYGLWTKAIFSSSSSVPR